MEFKYIAILAGLVLLVFLFYKEVRRVNKARLIWLIFANIIALSCFVLLIVPIKYETHVPQKTDEAILITEGTKLDSIASLKGKKYALSSADLKNTKAINIPDLSYFLKSNPNIRKLNIYGYGLNAAELEQLKGYQITFHPSANPRGIIAVNWPAKLKTTELLQVQGTYQNSGDETVKLLLKGLGKTVDSIAIEAKSNKSFSFKTNPKQTGKAIYELVALQKNDTLAKEPVPVQVGDQAPMKVLMLASFPDFEYKFLKNWLYENQYPLAFRSQISKNKFAFNFLNIDSINLNQINTSSLKKFDILIIDEEELAAISPNERSSIDLAVNNGMGLLIRIENTKALTTISGKFGRFESPALKGKPLNLILTEDHHKFSPLPLEQAVFLKASQTDQPIISDASGKTVVNNSISGYGKVLVSTLSSTYNWLLSGQKIDYTTYWSKLLANAARKRNDIQSVNIIPQFPVIHQKMRIIADLIASDRVPQLKIDSILLSPRQNMELPFQWDAFYWPQNLGWTNLEVNQTIEPVYIYKKADWEALKNQQKLDGTRQYIKNLNTPEAKNKLTDTILEEEVSLWWFFAGFLLATAFLWYEARILAVK
ncbi:hypothetical protein EZ456_19650 [Pedobacter psychrodurus]|uniref:Aerotolerance regulator N-terminal domain-containing protein n=1 Tax=Pedobacter psychrodurus TaxID=2530456 RepID=A0A4V2MPQ6_9SPHI|nr:hypothetical protein [Pedobacter psychrodurus]TCD20362.1 hypothetical protein EZ456_19650 [Pedobacter psychrodurus]